MPEAMHTFTPSGANLSPTKTAISLISIIDGIKSARGTDDDSYLIRLCGEFETQNSRHIALCESVGIEDEDGPASEACLICEDILTEIRDMAPRTLPGLIAKARVVSLAIRTAHEDLDGDLSCLDTDQEIALALAENLMAFGEARR